MMRWKGLVQRLLVPVSALAAFLIVSVTEPAGQQAGMALRIGASSAVSTETDAAKEKAALIALRSFIKEQTGLDNQITHEKDWRAVVDKMGNGQQQLGVFPGYEFAWAQEKDARIKPLVLAINGHRYPIAYLITRKDGKETDFAGVRGQPLAIPASSQSLVRLFVERGARANGQRLDEFFSKIVSPENIEDALDDVVDGVVRAAAIDQTGLEAYKRRKPGRFNQLKEVAHSCPFPPVVIAYYESSLDARTLTRFQDGLFGAARRERGEMLLTLYRLTGFETIPKDFDRILTETRKAYPVDGAGK